MDMVHSDRENVTERDATAPDAGGGRRYWRSLDELADSPEFRRFVADEFPGLQEELESAPNRRHFLKLMGASLGLAGLTACRWPKEMILPFANRPEERIPGVPQRYATAMELAGAAIGLVVASYDGRPVKVEGNPNHPDSLGAATAYAQASVLELYDPDRSRTVLRRGGGQEVAATWEDFLAFAGPHFAALRERRGRGFAILSEATSSPTVERLRARLGELFPEAAWCEWEPLSRDAEREGTRLAFGSPMRAHYHLDRADVVVSLDEDFLAAHPAALRHARQFAARRRAEDGTMNRLYVAEAAHSVTGAAADHRLPVATSRVAAVASRLATLLASHGVAVRVAAPAGATADPAAERFVAAAAADLAAARGRGLVMAGPRQPAEVHALVHAINSALGSIGTTVGFTGAPDPGREEHGKALARLAAGMGAGAVETLLVLGGNPVYDAPVDLAFAGALAKVPTTIHLSPYDDETSAKCTWHLPRAHALEAWADARAWDGTVSVIQPLIQPLHGGRTIAEVVAVVLGAPTGAHDLTRETLESLAGGGAWRPALAAGVVAGSSWVEQTPTLAGMVAQPPPAREQGLELVWIADASVLDGRFANNAWLQELPDPMTRLTWDNAACLAPATAAALDVRHGDVVRLSAGGRDLEIAAYVMPGQAADTVVVQLGYGRRRGGRVAAGAGFDAGTLRSSAALHFVGGAALTRTGKRYELASVQDHHAIDRLGMEEREHRVGELVRETTLAEIKAHPGTAAHAHAGPTMLPLWKELEFKGEHQWGMAIDLSACIGCNACTLACQAENNIPVVGKRQVIMGREMHWIRVDRYFTGTADAAKVVFQPVACQHCENAPCESVCPVAATVHSEEGLNQMVYNRCVGTRYCSNNCPYKVRRFNFFNYFKKTPQIEKLAFNPEVTVRARGVMEKCTFCIQRIQTAKIVAKNQRRPLRDGEIVPACAQTCPTEAIVFGDLADPESRVARQHRHPRAYGMLAELFTEPRNRYLTRLRNPADGVEEA